MVSANRNTQAWLAAAVVDYECAKALAPGHRGAVAYHLHQAAEKLLKALMIAAEIEPPRTPNLTVLWTVLSKEGILDEATPETADDLVMLTRFHWLGRYPMGDTTPSENILVREIEEGFRFVTLLKDRTSKVLEVIFKDSEDERPSP